MLTGSGRVEMGKKTAEVERGREVLFWREMGDA